MKNWIFLMLIFTAFSLRAQVAISDQAGPAVPDPTSILDLQSTTKGMLLSKIKIKKIQFFIAF
jgi:hypothetical protein